MFRISSFLGLLAALSSIVLWLVLIMFNPYSAPVGSELLIRTFFLLLLPACLAIYSSLRFKKMFMLVAFIWSLPLSLYLVLTPGIFSLFGLTNILYLISFIFMRSENKRHFSNNHSHKSRQFKD